MQVDEMSSASAANSIYAASSTEVSTDKVFMCWGRKNFIEETEVQNVDTACLHVCWFLQGNQQRCAEGRLSDCTVVV